MRNSRNRLRFLSRFGALSLASVALVAGISAAPAAAAPANVSAAAVRPAPQLEFVALGDSFTSGQGAPPYSGTACLTSQTKSYPAVSSLRSSYRLSANKACSGAGIAQIPAQLGGYSETTKLVTITVGGIDAGSTAVLQACSVDLGVACGAAVQTSLQTLGSPAFAYSLAQTYAYIAASRPNAQVAVLGYARLFERNPAAPVTGLVNDGTDALNAVIAGTVAAMGHPRVRFVDVSGEFDGHGIGSAVPYIAFDPANLLAPANFHPNAAGNAFGYHRALVNDRILARP